MNSIREAVIALDTNQFIFALRQDLRYPNCRVFLFEKLDQIQIYLPLQILIELQRNLADSEMRGIILALSKAKNVTWDYALAPLQLVKKVGKSWCQEGRCCNCRTP